MQVLVNLIYWFAEAGATSTSLNMMYDPEVPAELLQK